MSEEKSNYIFKNMKMSTELSFLAKRLKDIALDIERLSDEEKKLVIEKVDQQESFVLATLYNALLEYME